MATNDSSTNINKMVVVNSLHGSAALVMKLITSQSKVYFVVVLVKE